MPTDHLDRHQDAAVRHVPGGEHEGRPIRLGPLLVVLVSGLLLVGAVGARRAPTDRFRGPGSRRRAGSGRGRPARAAPASVAADDSSLTSVAGEEDPGASIDLDTDRDSGRWGTLRST